MVPVIDCVIVYVFVKLRPGTPCLEAAVSAGSCSLSSVHPHLLPPSISPQARIPLSPGQVGRVSPGQIHCHISPVLQQNIWDLLNETEVQVKRQEPVLDFSDCEQ